VYKESTISISPSQLFPGTRIQTPPSYLPSLSAWLLPAIVLLALLFLVPLALLFLVLLVVEVVLLVIEVASSPRPYYLQESMAELHALLDTYKAKSLPPTLWRVTHVYTRGRQPSGPNFDEDIEADGGLVTDEQGLKTAIQEHVDWLHRKGPSSLLSTFSNIESAVEYAIFQQHMAPAEANLVFLHEIDTGRLSDEGRKCVFSVDALKDELELVVPDHPDNQGEYLFLWSIPGDAIVDITAFSEPGIVVDLGTLDS
jgi:hypothetical protein